MNGLPQSPLTPDADALLMAPKSVLYCELGLSWIVNHTDYVCMAITI